MISTLSRRTMISATSVLGLGLATGAHRGAGAQATPQGDMQPGRVETEGDELACDVRGQGAPLLLIPGTPGDARGYALVAERLASDYTVITFDPRGFGRSTGLDPQNTELRNYEIGQQARDAVAVLAAAGHDAALIFGSSAGAVVGLELATNHPRVVAGLVAHEAPVIRVLPDAEQIQTRLAEIYLSAWTEGTKVAFLRFLEFAQIPANAGKPFTDADIELIKPNVDAVPELATAVSYVRYQMPPITSYKPAVQRIAANGVKVVMAAGESSLDLFYGRAAPLLAEQLGGPMVTFPGHHLSYTDPGAVDAWVATLREALGQL